MSGALSAASLGGCSARNRSLENPPSISQELSTLLGNSLSGSEGFFNSFHLSVFLGKSCLPWEGVVEGTDVADVGGS